ncbi:MAG: DUF1127 domain-containing protein [Silicimonas sp.]|nr:DUF1127 domain-containing protein [Silicimonas sp.]
MNARPRAHGAALPHLHRRPRRGSILTMIFALEDLWRSRRALNRLDSTALEDLGLSRDAAAAEAKRPVWDAPQRWFQ